jgi:hypothetical protein
MNITNTNIYLIMELIANHVPDDNIKHKILVYLLDNKYIQMIKWQIKYVKSKHGTALTLRCGHEYEIRPQQNKVQYLIMCEIRIAQFDADYEAGRRKANGDLRNIRKYMNLLDRSFKKRYKRLL